MNRIAARSVVGALRHGRNFNRYISTAPVAATPLDAADYLNRQNGTAFGSFYSRRMMSSVTPSIQTPPPAEKDQKESSAGDAKKGNDGVVVSNYWGISRPKITREDGTEWPWNCFMVSNSVVSSSRQSHSESNLLYCLLYFIIFN
jgi:ubiquinol oxidase